MSMFKPTAEEIKEATSGGGIKFKSNEEVTFLIKEVSEKTDEKNGGDKVLVKCDVIGGEHDGKSHTFWCNNNKGGKACFFGILQALFTEEQILAGLSPGVLCGKKVKSSAKITAKDGKEFANFYDFVEVSDVPGGLSDPNSDVPF